MTPNEILRAAVRHDELRRAARDALASWSIVYPRLAYRFGNDRDFQALAAAMTVLRRTATTGGEPGNHRGLRKER